MPMVLSDENMAKLAALINEMPHKHAVPLVHFINSVIAEQSPLEVQADKKRQKGKGINHGTL